MTDFREQVFKSRDETALKRFASRIPGYGGYLEKEMRRDADKLLRDYIAAQLDQQRKRLAEAQQELLSLAGGLDLMDDVDRVQKKLQLLMDRLRTAVYGYAGWFDAVVIREKELDALYNYDAQLLDGVDQVAAGVEAFAAAVAEEADVKESLRALKGTLNGLHEHVDRRRDVLTGAMPIPEAPAPERAASPELSVSPDLLPAPEVPPVLPSPTDTDTNTGL
jgi:hypothetical protein